MTIFQHRVVSPRTLSGGAQRGRHAPLRRFLVVSAAAAVFAASAPAFATGTWSVLPASQPGCKFDKFSGQACFIRAVLTDGSVLFNGVTSLSDTNWYKLTPDQFGSYQNGTWSQLQPSTNRYDYGPSAVLNDGTFWIAGGEGSSDPAGVETYDPVRDEWTLQQSYPSPPGVIQDGAATVLADGRVFCSWYLAGPGTTPIGYIWDPAVLFWFGTYAGPVAPSMHEQSFTLLPDGRVLALSAIPQNTPFVYSVSANTWTPGPNPAQPLTDSPNDDEMGPQVLLHSGKVLLLGAKVPGQTGNHNNVYDPVAGTWANTVPDYPPQGGYGDALAGVMFNGSVLITGGEGISTEYDPVANTFTPAPSYPAGEIGSNNGNQVLALPNGQILVAGIPDFLLYTPSGSPNSAWQPVITSLSSSHLAPGGTYTVTGTNLNGLTHGNGSSDDSGGATNYPIVYVKNALGEYTYFRTSNFNSMAPGQTTQFSFTVPNTLSMHGTVPLYVAASGVPSRPKFVTLP
jgi:hypothetical protein